MRLQKRYDVKVDDRLLEATRRIEDELSTLGAFDNIGAVVRSVQLMTAMTAISGTLADLWNALGDIIKAGQEDARTEALAMSFSWDDLLFRMGLTAKQRAAMKSSLLASSQFNVEAMLTRIYETRIPLAQQVYKTGALASGWVETRIDTALARGATVAELAKEVRDFVNPATRGGATYAARRLARTEINNAYHAVIIGHNADKPWNDGIKWNLSGSHPVVDRCDDYARRDHSGLGKGVYPPDDVPRKPHPQCLCYVYPVTVSPDLFLMRLKLGTYDEYLANTYGR